MVVSGSVGLGLRLERKGGLGLGLLLDLLVFQHGADGGSVEDNAHLAGVDHVEELGRRGHLREGGVFNALGLGMGRFSC